VIQGRMKSIPDATPITLTAGKRAGRAFSAGAQHWKRRADLFEVACGLITVGAHPNAGAQVLVDRERGENLAPLWAIETPSRALSSGERPSIRMPSDFTSPSLGLTVPAITLRSVVLPAPFGPIRPITRPRETSSVTFDNAVRPSKETETSAAARGGGRP
jgi:hypothetical protein